MLQAGLSLVRATINENRQQMQRISNEISQTYTWLKDNMNEMDFKTVSRVAKIAADKTYSRVKQEHLQKFARLKQENLPVNILRREWRNNSDFPQNTVRNESSRELSESENASLSKGMNFSPTPTSIPVKELIAATEHGLNDLCEGEANLVRSDVLRVLKKAKVPQPNISREERERSVEFTQE
ncbi:uncharacterized protein [Amphiura filiformis]|uniref:uncharacterized protein n=1 Tax=Amphiura filiformis TaxID=82378 RepID=UPI003B21E006